MPQYKTTGIIINRHNLGEADRILTILTPGQGTVRAVAKGVRRIKSKLAGHLELFCESELMLATGKTLDILTSARLIRHPSSVTSDYGKLRLAYLFAEMADKLSGEREHHTGLYDLVVDAYVALEEGSPDALLELWFKLRLLATLGYTPGLDGCVICGASGAEHAYAFHTELGGIVDLGCHSAGAYVMSQPAIKVWRLLLTRPLSAARQMTEIEPYVTEGLDICNHFYDYTFGRRFKSSEILK